MNTKIVTMGKWSHEISKRELAIQQKEANEISYLLISAGQWFATRKMITIVHDGLLEVSAFVCYYSEIPV